MDADSRLTLRERKKRKTRCELEAAALRLFVTRGFDAVTVEEITAAAEVSKRTFFRYFASKEDVVLAHHARHLLVLERLLAERPADEPVLAVVRGALVGLGTVFQEEREYILARAQVVLMTRSLHGRALELYGLFQEAIAEAVARRCGADQIRDLRVRLASGIAATALREALLVWTLGGGQASLPALVDRSFELAGKGLAELLPAQPRLEPVPGVKVADLRVHA